MPDATITPDQTGLYEQPINANTPYTVAITQRADRFIDQIEIINHGTDNLYFKIGTTTTPKDPTARIIGGGNYIDNITLPYGNNTITLATTTTGSFSISRK